MTPAVTLTVHTKPFHQQGDVILDPLENFGVEFPEDGTPVKPLAKGRGYPIAQSQATGHAHVVSAVRGVKVVDRKRVLDLPGNRRQDVQFWVRIPKSGAVLSHEEHHAIPLPPGDYVVRGVLEYDHFLEESRNVID